MNGVIFCRRMIFDEMWDSFLQNIDGFIGYHLFDITVYLCSLAACIIMFFVKKHIGGKWFSIISASCLSMLFYIGCAFFSSPLTVNIIWAMVAFLAPMAYLTVIGMLRKDWKNRLIVYGTAVLVVLINIIYCSFMEDHHKMCYSVKIFILLSGAAGYVKNIVNDKNSKNQKIK